MHLPTLFDITLSNLSKQTWSIFYTTIISIPLNNQFKSTTPIFFYSNQDNYFFFKWVSLKEKLRSTNGLFRSYTKISIIKLNANILFFSLQNFAKIKQIFHFLAQERAMMPPVVTLSLEIVSQMIQRNRKTNFSYFHSGLQL